jgi:pimeloyl-ACP methyl ester carboxylesterase
MLALKNFLSLFTIVTSLAGLATSQLVIPIVPELDPFYKPAPGFESTAPGTVLRTRKIASAYFGLIPNPVASYQLLYRTTAVDGSAIAAVTTVFAPTGAKKDRFVSFHTAYDGAARDGKCDPSFSYQLLSPQVNIISTAEFFLLQAFVADGNIVSSPDYEGPDAAFGAGRLAGMSVLDSMRAVASFKTLGFTSSKPAVVGYGYSGGAIATGWAAQLAATYAPEIPIKGWASGGTPANLTGTARLVDGTLFSGFLPQALAGLDAPSSYEAQLSPIYDQYLTPNGQLNLAAAEQICSIQNIPLFAFQAIQSPKFQTLGDRLFYEPTVRRVLDDNLMGQSQKETPTVPVYLFHAPDDEIIPYANATTLREEWCGYGASVEFVTVANGGHATTEIIGFPGAFNFVKAAFAGTVARGCSQKTILDDNLNPIALGASLEPILVKLINTLAIEGRKDANIIADVGTLNRTVT